MLAKNMAYDQHIYLIDFGVSQPYLNEDHTHVHLDLNTGFKGTLAFSSPKINIMSST